MVSLAKYYCESRGQIFNKESHNVQEKLRFFLEMCAPTKKIVSSPNYQLFKADEVDRVITYYLHQQHKKHNLPYLTNELLQAMFIH